MTLFPGAEVADVQPLADAPQGTDATLKVAGYGAPIRIVLRERSRRERVVVFRTATANEYGHDRRSDRAQQLLLAFDSFGTIPDHVRALDIGAIGETGELFSVREGGEFYLLTTWAPGVLYAEDLQRIAHEGRLRPPDCQRCESLAGWLARLHAQRIPNPAGYRRAVRDLVGHGEGIFGILDGYPDDVPAAPRTRLQGIEQRCLEWRWRLRGREGRLARTHGDFHPFNLLFDSEAGFTALDASRGACGEPADDVTALAINYVFFALDAPASWRDGLGRLWHAFWDRYLAATDDREALEVTAPWLTWRALVLASPRWYPQLSASARDRLLGLAERALGEPRFDPAWAEELFA
jgi:hypothetical protein